MSFDLFEMSSHINHMAKGLCDKSTSCSLSLSCLFIGSNVKTFLVIRFVNLECRPYLIDTLHLLDGILLIQLNKPTFVYRTRKNSRQLKHFVTHGITYVTANDYAYLDLIYISGNTPLSWFRIFPQQSSVRQPLTCCCRM